MNVSKVIMGLTAAGALASAPAWSQTCPAGYALAAGSNYCVISQQAATTAQASQAAQAAQQIAAGTLSSTAAATFVAAGVLVVATQKTTPGTTGSTN